MEQICLETTRRPVFLEAQALRLRHQCLDFESWKPVSDASRACIARHGLPRCGCVSTGAHTQFALLLNFM